MDCRIDIDSNGIIKVSGENASLFEEASSIYENDVDALSIYKISISDEFKALEIPATIENVVNFVDRSNVMEVSDFTQTELMDIYNTGRSINDFLEATTKDGVFKLDPANMESFYTKEEISEILTDVNLMRDVKEMWYKANNIGEVLDTYEFQKPIQEVVTESKGALGKYRKENVDKIYSEVGRVAAGRQTMEELEDAVYNSQQEFEVVPTEEILQEFRDKTLAPIYTENPLTGEIEKKEYNSTESRILHTLSSDILNSDITEGIDFINSIDNNLLEASKDATKGLLKTIELEAKKYGLDLIGLSESQKPMTQVKDLLNSLQNMIEELSDPTLVEVFAEEYNNFFDIVEDSNRAAILSNKGNDLMVIDTNRSEASLFEDYSVIKIEDNIYKKVNRETADIYEDLYKRVLQDPSIFNENIYYPYGFSAEGFLDHSKLRNEKYKNNIKENLKRAVNTELKAHITTEEYSQELVEEMVIHKIVNKSVEKVGAISKDNYYNTLYGTNTDQFVDNFLDKINKLLINNKSQNKPNPPLTFTQKGLELEYEGEYSAVETMYALPKTLQEGIIKYSQITGNMPTILTLANFEKTINIEEDIDFNRNFYSNFKQELPLYEGNVEVLNPDTIKAQSEDKFIRFRNDIYELNENKGTYHKVSEQEGMSWNRGKPYKDSNKVSQAVSLTSASTKVKVSAPKKQKQNIDNC